MTGAAKTTLGRMTQGARPSRRPPLKVGRVTKLTPEVSKKICDAVRAGNFVSVSARYAGVSEYTVNDWISRGMGTHAERSASPVYVKFVQDIEEAKAASEVAAVLHWRAAMPKDWKASEKWLQVTQPQRWRPPDDQTMRNGAFAAMQVNINGQTVSAGPNGHPEAFQAPIEALLEENPDLIASTMQILDQFLPIAPNDDAMAEIGAGSASDDQTDVIPGEFTEVGTENTSETPNHAFGGQTDRNEPEWSESDSESDFWRNLPPNDPNLDN